MDDLDMVHSVFHNICYITAALQQCLITPVRDVVCFLVRFSVVERYVWAPVGSHLADTILYLFLIAVICISFTLLLSVFLFTSYTVFSKK